MSKHILINASQAGEVWAAYTENGTLEDLFVESNRKTVRRGNIYRANVVSIDAKLKAAFIDYGQERNGFLALKDIDPRCYHRSPKGDEVRIQDVLIQGKPILVQLTKEESSSKGAGFTTEITLASAYTVFAPYSSGSHGMSRKITDNQTKKELKKVLKAADPDKQYGVMIRTAAEGQSSEDILHDFQNQVRAWGHIQADFAMNHKVGILYRESQLVTRMVRDHFTHDLDQIVVDTPEALEVLQKYCQERLPVALERIHFHELPTPLFTHYRVEEQINQLTAHQIDLPSGGNISINHTEALTVFDINSSRQSGRGEQQQMFLETNCEAAEMIARQIRLRGIGGLIVIDFINLHEMAHRRQVEKVFKEATKRDRAYLEIGVLSRFCILALSRNRIQERSLSTTHTTCPSCQGSGYVPSPNIVAFKLINLLYSYAEKLGPGKKIYGKLPVNHAVYLLNEKRKVLMDLEERYGVMVEIVPDFTQSLLAPNPFSEYGGKALESKPERRERRPERRERRSERSDKKGRGRGRKERPDSRDRRPTKAKTLDPVKMRKKAYVYKEDQEETTTPTETPVQTQIIGFIPPEQLKRASMMDPNQAATRDELDTSSEVTSSPTQESTNDENRSDSNQRKSKKERRNRNRRNRNRRNRQTQHHTETTTLDLHPEAETDHLDLDSNSEAHSQSKPKQSRRKNESNKKESRDKTNTLRQLLLKRRGQGKKPTVADSSAESLESQEASNPKKSTTPSSSASAEESSGQNSSKSQASASQRSKRRMGRRHSTRDEENLTGNENSREEKGAGEETQSAAAERRAQARARNRARRLQSVQKSNELTSTSDTQSKESNAKAEKSEIQEKSVNEGIEKPDVAEVNDVQSTRPVSRHQAVKPRRSRRKTESQIDAALPVDSSIEVQSMDISTADQSAALAVHEEKPAPKKRVSRRRTQKSSDPSAQTDVQDTPKNEESTPSRKRVSRRKPKEEVSVSDATETQTHSESVAEVEVKSVEDETVQKATRKRVSRRKVAPKTATKTTTKTRRSVKTKKEADDPLSEKPEESASVQETVLTQVENVEVKPTPKKRVSRKKKQEETGEEASVETEEQAGSLKTTARKTTTRKTTTRKTTTRKTKADAATESEKDALDGSGETEQIDISVVSSDPSEEKAIEPKAKAKKASTRTSRATTKTSTRKTPTRRRTTKVKEAEGTESQDQDSKESSTESAATEPTPVKKKRTVRKTKKVIADEGAETSESPQADPPKKTRRTRKKKAEESSETPS